MTTRRASRGRSRRSAPRRRTMWDTFVFPLAGVGQAAIVTAHLSAGVYDPPSPGRKGLTVLRMIGSLTVTPTSLDLNAQFAAGITMVDGDPLEADQHPSHESGESWLWWQSGALHDDTELKTERYPIDSRSRRRFRERDSQLRFYIENHSADNITFNFFLGMRVLYALP